MVKEAFVTINFQAKTLAVIEQANTIIAEYAAQGFTMTLRQLYYQFVSRDLMPNKFNPTSGSVTIVSDARNAGLIDWDAIEDRTRELVTHNSWDSPEEIIGAVARQYREDIWEDQHYRPEVWIEKAALLGVVAPICDEFRVPYFAHIGNNSQSRAIQGRQAVRRTFRPRPNSGGAASGRPRSQRHRHDAGQHRTA